MQCNVGGVDRWIRIVLGLLLVSAGVSSAMWWLVVVGVIVFLTGAFKWCALYSILKISTCKEAPVSGQSGVMPPPSNNSPSGMSQS